MNRTAVSLAALGFSFAAVLCPAAERSPEEARAIAAIEKLGGRTIVDEQIPEKPVISVDFQCTAINDAGLANIETLTQLQRLNLEAHRLRTQGWLTSEG